MTGVHSLPTYLRAPTSKIVATLKRQFRQLYTGKETHARADVEIASLSSLIAPQDITQIVDAVRY